MPTVVEKVSIKNAQKLRREATKGERRLWSELREFKARYGVHVRRQVPIGPYVADFAVHKQKLVIEVDGEFHFTKKGIRKTRERDKWFAARGYDVLHIDTGELSRNFEGCINSILFKLGLMN